MSENKMHAIEGVYYIGDIYEHLLKFFILHEDCAHINI